MLRKAFGNGTFKQSSEVCSYSTVITMLLPLDVEMNDTHSPYCSYFVFLFYAEINRLKIPKKHKYL